VRGRNDPPGAGRVGDSHAPAGLARRRAQRPAVSADVNERPTDATGGEHGERAIDPIPHADAAKVELGVTIRQPRRLARELDHRRGDRLARLGDFGRRGLARARPMEAPHPHEWLHRRVEAPPARMSKRPRQPEDRQQVPVHPHRSAAGVPVELAEIAGVVEEGESPLDPP